MSPDESRRKLGLTRATLVGVGAIVGGGVLALAGTAFAAAGPAAIIAFALNGIIAFGTAHSFAAMASAFPRSGGSYTYAKMVFSVRTAFAVGWVVWFASIVAGVLYALGAAVYAVIIARELVLQLGLVPPAWLDPHHRITMLLLAGGAAVAYALTLLRKAAGGGVVETVGKVVILVAFIALGLHALASEPAAITNASPWLPHGAMGVIEAMGFTFIALQGFDLIAAVGGEVKRPQRNLPRAMYLSLALALLLYLPLLLVLATVGAGDGGSITALAERDPDAVIAVAARNIAGAPGFWLIATAALLAMLSGLQANIYAASRIALSMARDRTLPWWFGRVSQKRGTPVGGVVASTLLLLAILLVVPDVASAGAAASLIFLVTFALVHSMVLLARKRGAIPKGSTMVTLLPICSGIACLALAVFQGVVVPRAGLIAAVWVAVGAATYVTLFARRAEALDAADMARDPLIGQARGANPLVLLPVANPDHASGLVSVAHALTPPVIGRVLLLSVVRMPDDWQPPDPPPALRPMQAVLGDTLTASLVRGLSPEALTTVASDPWTEIARVAKTHDCGSLLLGMSELSETEHGQRLEQLMSAVDADVMVLRAKPDWQLSEAKRIVVPVAGRGPQDELRARLLGSLSRTAEREVTYLRVLEQDAPDSEFRRTEKLLERVAEGEAPGFGRVLVLRSDDPLAEVREQLNRADLTIIGMQRLGRDRKHFGTFAMTIVQQTDRALLLISRRG